MPDQLIYRNHEKELVGNKTEKNRLGFLGSDSRNFLRLGELHMFFPRSGS